MPEYPTFDAAPPIDPAIPCRSSFRDKILVGFVLFTLVRTSQALAGDQASSTSDRVDAEAGPFRSSSSPAPAVTPPTFLVPVPPGSPQFSATDFSPRRHTLDVDSVKPYADMPMLRGTTVWQRMAEYKSHDRVRLLTLWETSGSTISLQAGKKGGPSLQWNSRLMNREGSTQGLLDRFFAVSLAHAGSNLRNAARPAASIAASKQAESPVVAGLK